MNKTLNEIILDWIYSDRDGISVEKIEIYSQALSDLRARVPDLVEKLEKLIDEKVGNAIEDYNERNY